MVKFLHNKDWASIHREKAFRYDTPVLALFSLLYGAAQRLRYGAYDLGILKKKRLPGLVVSVGNITAGGTGKTPLAAALAKWALAERMKPCIISRGYGGGIQE